MTATEQASPVKFASLMWCTGGLIEAILLGVLVATGGLDVPTASLIWFGLLVILGCVTILPASRRP